MMKKQVLLSFLLFISAGLFATDTLRYPNGKIESIYDHYHYYKRYYMNGQLQYKHTSETMFRKGKNTDYDSLGNVISKGRTKFNGHRWGRWEFYSNGHRDSTVTYRYGINKKNLRTADSRKIRCILFHGLGSLGYSPCNAAVQKYAVRHIPIGGCVIPKSAYTKANMHNFYVYLGQMLRYGRYWEAKEDELCKEK